MAMYLGVFVVGIFSLSALAVLNLSSNQFRYVHSLYRRSDDCNLCYGEDCLPFDQVRCDYYSETDIILSKGEEPEGFMDLQLQNEVDSLMYDIAEKVNQSPDLKCIPYISRYTDCTKENICLGCKTCSCNEDGLWNCTTPQCHMQAPAIDVDHRVLIMTIENLNASLKISREKRSVTDNPFQNINGSTLSLEQLSEWIYGVTRDEPNTKSPNNEEIVIVDTKMEPFSIEQQNLEQLNTNITPKNKNISLKNDVISTTTETAITSQSEYTDTPTVPTYTVTTDSEYLAFDEVLSNIAIDSKNYSRRKSLIDFLPNYSSVLLNKTTEFDYMLLDDDKTTSTVNTDITSESPYVVDFAEQNDGTEPNLDDATKVVIDLLDSAKKVQLFNDTDYVEMGPNKDVDLVGVGFDNTNDIFEYNPMNIMKREVSGVTEATTINDTHATDISVITINYTENQTPHTNHETKLSLKNNVLLPLTKLINSKRNELDDLKNIKENLISVMNYYNESPIVEIIDYPNISDSNILHDVEMFPDLGYDLRRTNPHVMQKFLYKLKADIYEVLKDIIGLERYREGKLPDDLSLLIHSLKRYARPKYHTKHQKSSEHNHKPFQFSRRTMNSNNNKCTESTFKQCMIEILQAVDKDMPKTNALGSLSPTMRRILRYVIRTYNTGEYDTIGHKVHDPNYNMTNDLKDIGSSWQEMANNAIGSSPHETMYKMKLLHFLMEKDLSKINDALAVIDFAHSRRMIPFFKSVSNDVFQHINKGLNSVHNNVEIIVQYHAKSPRTLTKEPKNVIGHRLHAEDVLDLTTPADINTDISTQHKHKKISFIKHIRNLLKSSKKDIAKLLHKQVPKSEIVKQLAKQKLNEIAQRRYDEYEKTMKKWQKDLGIMPIRYKRDVHTDHVRSRIKNIIPNYLRHKVDPKLQNKKNSTKNKHKQKKKHDRKTTLTTATTPNTKTTRRSITTRKAHKSKGTTAKVKTTKFPNKNKLSRV